MGALETGSKMRQKAEHTIFDPSQIPGQETSDANRLAPDPVVSVSMVTYNHARWIGQAIESVVGQQTDFPFELIVAEDCSTDETRRIVLEYQKRYPQTVRVITSAHNVGVKRNAWRSHLACRGRYVAACEGDDYWHHPLKLQKQVDFLESHPDYGLVHSDCDVLLERTARTVRSQDKVGGRIPYAEADLFSAILVGTYRIRTASVCMRKTLLDRVMEADPILFQSDRFPMGDTPLWLELSRLAKFKYLDESLATYRVLSESASQSGDLQKVIRFEKSCYDLREYFLAKYPCRPQTRAALVRKWQGRFLDLAFKAGDTELAEQAWQRLRQEGVAPGFRGIVKRWAASPGWVNRVARAVQAYTRPVRTRNTDFCRY